MPRALSRCAEILVVVCLSGGLCTVRAAEPAVQYSADGKLSYAKDLLGNRIPDFSHCGYDGGNSAIPEVPVRILVEPAEGDDRERIQAAIDHLAELPQDAEGFRGAIRLARGEFQVEGQLLIHTSGIVLQGSSAGQVGTVIRATGLDRRALIRVLATEEFNQQDSNDLHEIIDSYVPVGTKSLTVKSAAGFSVGDTVLITRTSTQEWISSIGCDLNGLGWKPGTRDLRWERQILRISGNKLVLDGPITTAIDMRDASATVQRIEFPGRLENIGIEDLRLHSDYSTNNQADEDHAWYGITIDQVKNAWIRRTVFQHFSGGAVLLGSSTNSVTVEDCISRLPISELGGYRRHTYFTLGQAGLFNRCWSEEGRHDFSAGHCAAGPNAFVQCRAINAHASSGPIESWASGVLYDNVRIDGSDLELQNRWNTPPHTGWSAANCVLWQCRAANARCFRPPGANNWAIGSWATPAGDGTFENNSNFVKPLSLYQAQLEERVGKEAGRRVEPLLGKPIGATNPSYDQAADFVSQSQLPAKRLVDVIRENIEIATRKRKSESMEGAISAKRVLANSKERKQLDGFIASPEKAGGKLSIENGWLVVDSQLKTGRRHNPSWWRGRLNPGEARPFGINISRFAPGRSGDGLTNHLRKVADRMASGRFASYEHHYGLWYDRRRDDHLMVRRSTGGVAPPFYEQPFTRTGVGTAWDGLSKYDLTANNPWYWNRLHNFARMCDQRGLLLVHHNYFQHNILEAGAHWADCPWRPANNINDLELPEPPPYIGDKRLFMAQHFYNIRNPKLRALHRRYIRQCLNAFDDCSNVLQTTSAEFTGPLEFVQFWLDTIAEWQLETGKNAHVALSCTKDVQDAILGDPDRASLVDVIDIRYWMVDKNLNLYAPKGGKHLAPRQHLRRLGSKESSFASIVQAVREYRTKHPEKAILYNADQACRSGNDGWAVLMGGGSLPDVKLPPQLAAIVPSMQPSDQDFNKAEQRWSLRSPAGELLLYSNESAEQLRVLSPSATASYKLRWIDTSTGAIISEEVVRGDSALQLTPKSQAVWISKVGSSN